MKITTKTSHTTTIKGTLHENEVKAYIRDRLQLPASATVHVFVMVPSGGDYSGEVLAIMDGIHDLEFEVTITGDVDVAPTPDMGMLEELPRCTAGDCKFPSLAGGLCASHMSEAHRRRYATLPSR